MYVVWAVIDGQEVGGAHEERGEQHEDHGSVNV